MSAAVPPPAPMPAGEKAYQLLYAGELGKEAFEAGQRVRILAWLDYVKFSASQLKSLAELTQTLSELMARQSEFEAELARKEQDLLAPVYAELAQKYRATQSPTEAELTQFAARIEKIRQDLYGESGFQSRHYKTTYDMVQRAKKWVEAIDKPQQERIITCRFFLQRRLGPFTNPGDYGKWLGTAWNGADFASMTTASRPVNEGQMDIGGLWSAETVDGGDTVRITGLRLGVLLLFTVQEPAFQPALAEFTSPQPG